MLKATTTWEYLTNLMNTLLAFQETQTATVLYDMQEQIPTMN